MVVTQWNWCRENDETASVRRVSGRVANEASLKRVVVKIVTEIQVTMLNPWRGRPHVYKVSTLFYSAQMSMLSALHVNGSVFIMTVCHSSFEIK